MVFENRQYAGELFRDELVEMCETEPDASCSTTRPGRRLRRLPGARRLGPARRPRLQRGGPVPPLRVARCWRRPGVLRPPGVFDEESPPDPDPVDTPSGLEHAQPEGGRRSRRGRATSRLPHPARRSAARLQYEEPRRRRRSRSTAARHASASSTRSTSLRGPAAAPTTTSPTARASSWSTASPAAASWTARSSPTRSRRTPTRPITRDQTGVLRKQWVDVPCSEAEIAADRVSSESLDGG